MINTTGDGFFVSFESPDEAAQCAVEIQRALAQHRKDAGFSPRLRIGVHAGPVLVAEGDLLGQEVHLAARIGSAAGGEEILLSVDTMAALGAGFSFGESYTVTPRASTTR